MSHILIVESNTADIVARQTAERGETEAEGYARVLGQLREGLRFSIANPYTGDDPDLDDFDAVVFTGSSVVWNTDDDRAEPLRACMARVFEKRLPTFGSCNGMQLAASVLGGSSRASPNGREDGIARDVRLTEAGRKHPMMADRQDGFAVPCVHRDEVRVLPEGATLLAGNAHSPVQAFAYERDGVRFWGCQYHPEYRLASLSGYLLEQGRVTPQTSRDLATAESDAEAAARLGTTPEAQALETRTLELRNWLASL